MADQVLQDIKDRLNVVDVISSYIPVKKSGTNFKAVCPFHNEKTPSLMISPQKQIWHCFGCGEGGDIFGFVMRHENITFREALEILAQKAGITLPERAAGDSQAKKINEELVRVNNFAAKYYHQLLGSPIASGARDYLSRRGLTTQTLTKWQIGFAPDSFDSLLKALAAKQVTQTLALQAGVLAKNDRGNVFDRFRNRITFPIFNYYGNVVGFTARILEGDQTAKYINSPETGIYNKSKILFGLNFAREAIRKADEVVVVEGQMDCITAHQAGFENTVATSGTALTEDHLRLLSRLTKNIKFSFDQDSAGDNALRRAGELALPMGFRIKVITIKDAKDPDELIRKSAGLWKRAVADGVWFIDHYLNLAGQNFPTGSLEQKQFLSEQVVSLLTFVTDPLERDHYFRSISDRFGISEGALRTASPSQQETNKEIVLPKYIPITPESIQEKEILGGLMNFNEYRNFVAEEGLPTEYISPSMQNLINTALVGQIEIQPGQESLANEAAFMIESSLENLANNELALMRELKKSFYLFKLAGIKRKLQDTTTAIKKAESLHNPEEINNLNQLFAQLSSERYTLETKLAS